MPRHCTIPPRLCSVPGCPNKHWSKGYCDKHYRRLQRHGDLNAVRPTWEQRFWRKVMKTDGCWEWTGATKNGYGRIKRDETVEYAHRVSYELHFGPIPDGLNVCHTCDKPLCVRPDHFFLGTHADNAADKCAKGRAGAAKGEQAGRAKLTENQVKEARSKYAAGGITIRALAAEYGLTPSAMRAILNHTHWKHVP